MLALVPRLKPAAPNTWEIRAALAGNEEQSGRITIEFPTQSTVVGAYVSVIRTSAGNLVVPTIDDILALVDVDNETRFTSGPSQSQTTAAARGSQFVTLASLDTRYRDLYLELTSPRPVLGMTFSWKRGANVYEDALIGVALFTLPGIQEPRA